MYANDTNHHYVAGRYFDWKFYAHNLISGGWDLLDEVIGQSSPSLNYAFDNQHALVKAEVKVTNGCNSSNIFDGFIILNTSTICQNDLLVNIQTTQPSCTNPRGSAVASVAGSGTYYYEWSDAVHTTTANIDDLLPGIYFVTVTSSDGSQGIGKTEILPFQNFTLETNTTPATCNLTTGKAEVVVNGVTSSNLSYVWSNGYSGGNWQDSLVAGIYAVTVTD